MQWTHWVLLMATFCVVSDGYHRTHPIQPITELTSCWVGEAYHCGYVEERAFWGYGGNLSGPH